MKDCVAASWKKIQNEETLCELTEGATLTLTPDDMETDVEFTTFFKNECKK